MTSTALAPAVPRTAVDAVLRVAVAAALMVDAVVHWRLAAGYGIAFPAGVGGEVVFRVEAVAATVVAVLVLYRGSRLAWASAVAVLASAFVAVIAYRYLQIPQLGPIPAMYEPIWYTEKTISAVAEGLGALLATIGLIRAGRGGRRRAGP